jgi:hypothetical protein
VPESIMLLSLSNRLMAFGPIKAPAIINPRIWGILNLFRIMGAKRMIIRIIKNLSTGWAIGSETSEILNIIICCTFYFCLHTL